MDPVPVIGLGVTTMGEVPVRLNVLPPFFATEETPTYARLTDVNPDKAETYILVLV
jgi:hypothetical protein